MNLGFHKVTGNSMSPTMNNGDFVMSFGYKKSNYQSGDVVLIKHPRYGLIVKRILEIDISKGVYLTGDNPLSVSSQEMGWTSLKAVTGKVIWHIKNKARTHQPS